jgi:peptide/nickel transport system permease protein
MSPSTPWSISFTPFWTPVLAGKHTMANTTYPSETLLLNAPPKKEPLGLCFWFPSAWIALVTLLAITAPYWPLPDHDRIDWNHPAAPPGTMVTSTAPGNQTDAEPTAHTYWLGTDTFGRDIVARLAFGARVSLLVGIFAPTIGFVLGGGLGLLSGFYRGRVETLVMVLMDAILAFPALVLLLAVTMFWGSKLSVLIPSLALLSVPSFCRVVRAGTLSWSQREFILAARAIGASDSRILLFHIVPNILPAAVAYGLLTVAVVIIAEGTLSFLGLSVPPPSPSWGGMIAEGKEVLSDAPHVSLVPATVMFLTVLSFNMLGDRLREIGDRKVFY